MSIVLPVDLLFKNSRKILVYYVHLDKSALKKGNSPAINISYKVIMLRF